MNSASPDRIRLSGLRAHCTLGVLEWERLVRREVRIDLTLHLDLRRPGISDNLTDTVDYGTVARRVVDFTAASEFRLLEALAGGIADLCLEFPQVERIDVTVQKMGALDGVEKVAVDVTRSAREG